MKLTKICIAILFSFAFLFLANCTTAFAQEMNDFGGFGDFYGPGMPGPGLGGGSEFNPFNGGGLFGSGGFPGIGGPGYTPGSEYGPYGGYGSPGGESGLPGYGYGSPQFNGYSNYGQSNYGYPGSYTGYFQNDQGQFNPFDISQYYGLAGPTTDSPSSPYPGGNPDTSIDNSSSNLIDNLFGNTQRLGCTIGGLTGFGGRNCSGLNQSEESGGTEPTPRLMPTRPPGDTPAVGPSRGPFEQPTVAPTPNQEETGPELTTPQPPETNTGSTPGGLTDEQQDRLNILITESLKNLRGASGPEEFRDFVSGNINDICKQMQLSDCKPVIDNYRDKIELSLRNRGVTDNEDVQRRLNYYIDNNPGLNPESRGTPEGSTEPGTGGPGGTGGGNETPPQPGQTPTTPGGTPSTPSTDQGTQRIPRDTDVNIRRQLDGTNLWDKAKTITNGSRNAEEARSRLESSISQWAQETGRTPEEIKSYLSDKYKDDLLNQDRTFYSQDNGGRLNCRINYYFAHGGGCNVEHNPNSSPRNTPPFGLPRITPFLTPHTTPPGSGARPGSSGGGSSTGSCIPGMPGIPPIPDLPTLYGIGDFGSGFSLPGLGSSSCTSSGGSGGFPGSSTPGSGFPTVAPAVPTSRPFPTTPLPTPIPTRNPTPSPTAISNSSRIVNHLVTLYGWPDNDPPGSAISYPHSEHSQTIHNQAGGSGTYDDPITMATDPTEWPIGTRVYLPFLKKYAIMEDWCAHCVDDWKSQKYHIDIWISSNDSFKDQVLQCEDHWTQDSTAVEINPPPGKPVFTGNLFNMQTGACLQTIP